MYLVPLKTGRGESVTATEQMKEKGDGGEVMEGKEEPGPLGTSKVIASHLQKKNSPSFLPECRHRDGLRGSVLGSNVSLPRALGEGSPTDSRTKSPQENALIKFRFMQLGLNLQTQKTHALPRLRLPCSVLPLSA